MELDQYKKLGARIKTARMAAGLSQEALGELVGLTSQHISHTENATTKVSLPALVRIANVLQVSVDKLLSDSLYDAKPLFLDEFRTILQDCTADEVYVMLQVASASKHSLRLRGLRSGK